MNLDELIAHLQAVRGRHGGGHEVMLGQENPDSPAIWSGVPLVPSMVRESVSEVSTTSVPGYGVKAGWIWFEVPKGGIRHRKRKNYRDRLTEDYDADIGSVVGCGLDRLERHLAVCEIQRAVDYYQANRKALCALGSDRRTP